MGVVAVEFFKESSGGPLGGDKGGGNGWDEFREGHGRPATLR
jgi:hypothetical protein